MSGLRKILNERNKYTVKQTGGPETKYTPYTKFGMEKIIKTSVREGLRPDEIAVNIEVNNFVGDNRPVYSTRVLVKQVTGEFLPRHILERIASQIEKRVRRVYRGVDVYITHKYVDIDYGQYNAGNPYGR